MPNQSRFVFTEGVERVRLVRYVQTEPFMIAEVETVDDLEADSTSSIEALVRNVVGQFQQIVSESATLSDELRTIAGEYRGPQPPGRFCCLVAAVPHHRRQADAA